MQKIPGRTHASCTFHAGKSVVSDWKVEWVGKEMERQGANAEAQRKTPCLPFADATRATWATYNRQSISAVGGFATNHQNTRRWAETLLGRNPTSKSLTQIASNAKILNTTTESQARNLSRHAQRMRDEYNPQSPDWVTPGSACNALTSHFHLAKDASRPKCRLSSTENENWLQPGHQIMHKCSPAL